MNIEITKEEAQTLINLIDIAIRKEGYNAAKAGVYFIDKITAEANKEIKADD